VLGTPVPPVLALARGALATTGTVTLGTTLRPLAVRTTLLPTPAASVLGPAAGGTPSLPGTLPATTRGASARTGPPALRTALPGAAAASSGSLSAGTAGTTSRLCHERLRTSRVEAAHAVLQKG
jgi:hypothetical protein